MSEYIKINDTVYFTANFYHPTSGFSYAADATPAWLVYESGATPILQGDMVSRNISGSYWGNFIASDGNGFVSERHYDVQVSGTIGGITGFAKVKEFVVGDLYDVNVVQVSGDYVHLNDFGGGAAGVSAADVRAEMDANSLMFTAISGQALTAAAVRAEMDANSLQFVAISGNVGGLAGAAMRGTDNAATYAQLTAVSGSILQSNVVQVSGAYIHSDLTTVSTQLQTIKTTTDKLDSMVEEIV